MNPDIQFHILKENFDPGHKEALSSWLLSVAKKENKRIGCVNYIFCSDEYLLDLNKKFLDHDYYTDILSFPSNNDPVEGDIFISVDRVEENAKTYSLTFNQELNRVIIHGLLHFFGYDDHEENDKKLMREKEDLYIDLIK